MGSPTASSVLTGLIQMKGLSGCERGLSVEVVCLECSVLRSIRGVFVVPL